MNNIDEIRNAIDDSLSNMYAASDFEYESELKQAKEELEALADDCNDSLLDQVIEYVEENVDGFSYDALTEKEIKEFKSICSESVEDHIIYLYEKCDVEDDLDSDYYDEDDWENN